MKKIYFLIIFLMVSFVAGTTCYSATTIKINPETEELPQAGETFAISVDVNDIENTGAFDFTLNYDPSVVIIDSENSVSISSDLLNSGKDYKTANLEIDNNTGTIRFAVYSLGSTPGPGGNVSLAEIIFTVQDRTISSLTLENVTLTDSLGNQYFDIQQNNGELVITHNITATAGTNGKISPSGDVKVIQGNNQAFTITPDTGYHISDLTVDGISVDTASSYIFSNVTADHTISAEFDVNTFNVTFEPGAGGSLTGNTSQIVDYGNNSTSVEAVPDSGYEFTGWTGDYTSKETSITINEISKDMTVTAGFKIRDMTLYDAVIGLKILCGIELEYEPDIPDINKDTRIGIEEIIYILQNVSGIRENIICN